MEFSSCNEPKGKGSKPEKRRLSSRRGNTMRKKAKWIWVSLKKVEDREVLKTFWEMETEGYRLL